MTARSKKSAGKSKKEHIKRNRAADLRRRAEEMAAIIRVSHKITSLSNLQQVYESIARHASELSQSDASGVFNLRSDGRLYVEFGYGVQNEFIEAINAEGIPPGHGAIGQATTERRPVQTRKAGR